MLSSAAPRRGLVAVLAADVAGYSRLSGIDELGTHIRLRKTFREIVGPLVHRHGGQVLQEAGDGFLASFQSVTAAVQCGLDIQGRVEDEERQTPRDRRIRFRVAVNTGEVIFDNNTIYGDTVNVAARVQSIANPGEVWLTYAAYEQAKKIITVAHVDIGNVVLKNISQPVHVVRLHPLSKEGAPALPASAGRDRGRDLPVIVVRPIVDWTSNDEHQKIAEILTEEIAARLSKWRWFDVIPLAAGRIPGADGSADDLEIGRHASADYILRGSLRVRAKDLRLTVLLMDAATGHELWAEAYDCPLAALSRMEDDIAVRIVVAVDLEMQRAEQARAMRRDAFGARDLIQRAYWHYHRRTRHHHEQALELFREATALDPGNAVALTGQAACKFWAGQWRWASQPIASLQEAMSDARQAIDLDPRFPPAHLMLAQTHLFLGNHDAAIRGAKNALALNPSYAGAWAFLGHALTAAGKFRAALAPIRRAFRLTPRDSRHFMWLANLALVHYHLDEFEQAERLARASSDLLPQHWLSRQVLVTSLVRLGRAEEAERLIEAEDLIIRSASLSDFANRLPYKNPAHAERISSPLRYMGFLR